MGYWAWRRQFIDTLKKFLKGTRRLDDFEVGVMTFPLYNNNVDTKAMYAYLEENDNSVVSG